MATATGIQPPVIYRLQSSRQLPSIRLEKCVKHVLFQGRALQVCNLVLRRSHLVQAVLYWVGWTVGSIAMLVPKSLGEVLAPWSLWQDVGNAAAILALRYDFVALTLTTYDFWYLTFSNALATSLIMVTLGPIRALAALAGSIGFQVGLLVDASFRATRPFIVASLLGSLIYLLYAVARSLGLTDFRQIVLLRTPHRELMAEDVVINTVITFALIDARNGVRNKP
ncbi:hypothetical protein ATCC90586_006055 [Pythium insidiosum]|nr:hypothetical protein ATCC90586_006055 [Pythium insidiosum]